MNSEPVSGDIPRLGETGNDPDTSRYGCFLPDLTGLAGGTAHYQSPLGYMRQKANYVNQHLPLWAGFLTPSLPVPNNKIKN